MSEFARKPSAEPSPNCPRGAEENDLLRSHPLESLAYFRQFPRTWWRDLLYTLIWSLGLGVLILVTALMLFSPESVWLFIGRTLLITLCIGYSIHAVFHVLNRWLGAEMVAWPRWRKVVTGFLASLVGALLGYVVSFAAMDRNFFAVMASHPGSLISILVFTILLCGVLMLVFSGRQKSAQVERDLATERARVAESERRALDAQLRMLQAQIEPHFLYNTLANVVGLIDPAPAKAKQMLVDFIAYLRLSLAATRADAATLGGELALIEAYVNILAVRMGARMRFRNDVAENLKGLPLPPMLLQPLVENAVKHGLEPKVEGGEIVISALVDDTQLRVEVADTGLGFAALAEGPVATRGTGVGLANLKERLRALFGEHGRLSLSENTPCGVRAVLEVPLPAIISSTGKELA